MPAVLDPLEVRAHVLGAPDGSPVRSAMLSQSELCGQTKIIALCAVQPPSVPARGYQTPSTCLPLYVSTYFGSRALLRLVGVVADEEVPSDRVVLGRERMEGGDVVVLRQRVRAGLWRIAARDRCGSPPASSTSTRIAGFGEPRRHRAAAGARADDDVVGARGRRGCACALRRAPAVVIVARDPAVAPAPSTSAARSGRTIAAEPDSTAERRARTR